MGEEKRNKIVAAITVNAVLLIFIILAVIIAQVIQISVLKRRRDRLKAEIVYYTQQYDKAEDMLDKLEVGGELYELIIEWQQQGVYTRAQIFEILGIEDPELKNEVAVAPVLAIVVE